MTDFTNMTAEEFQALLAGIETEKARRIVSAEEEIKTKLDELNFDTFSYLFANDSAVLSQLGNFKITFAGLRTAVLAGVERAKAKLAPPSAAPPISGPPPA